MRTSTHALRSCCDGAGHEVSTVGEQGLHGTEDPDLFKHCVAEDRVIVTLDLDFSNVLRYPPERTPGLIVLRGPDDLFPTVRIYSSRH